MFKANAAVRPLARGIAAAVGFMLATPAFAQVAPTAPVQAQVPGQTPQDIDPAARTPALQPATIDPATLAIDASCPFAGKGALTLSRIEVVGATLVPQAELQRAVADLVGRSADAGVLCTARDRVAAVYAARGEALARVDLPQQTIRDGVLTLQVTEGRVVSTVIGGAEAQGPSAELARAYLAQASGDGATRWADVERAFV